MMKVHTKKEVYYLCSKQHYGVGIDHQSGKEDGTRRKFGTEREYGTGREQSVNWNIEHGNIQGIQDQTAAEIEGQLFETNLHGNVYKKALDQMATNNNQTTSRV